MQLLRGLKTGFLKEISKLNVGLFYADVVLAQRIFKCCQTASRI